MRKEVEWLLEEKYGGEKCHAFFADIKKLENGIPLAYLIGSIPFLNCQIDLEYKPLIPRPETEFWVNNFLKQEIASQFSVSKEKNVSSRILKRGKNKKIKILDLFSGSGCIGIGILKNEGSLPACLIEVDFGEKNLLFIKQIKKNLKLNKINKNKSKVFQSDIFSKIPKTEKEKEKYDFILANPPYISEKLKNTVQESVLKHENYASLFASDNGLFFIKKILKEGFDILKSTGKIYIEFDSWQVNLLKKYLEERKIKYKFQKDQYKKNRVLILFK